MLKSELNAGIITVSHLLCHQLATIAD